MEVLVDFYWFVNSRANFNGQQIIYHYKFYLIEEFVSGKNVFYLELYTEVKWYNFNYS